MIHNMFSFGYFNPQGPRGPRLFSTPDKSIGIGISIHKALAGLDNKDFQSYHRLNYFNPQGPRGPRHSAFVNPFSINGFQSTRPSRASTDHAYRVVDVTKISIHKALAGLDSSKRRPEVVPEISIHKALAGLDFIAVLPEPIIQNFNPQGPRGPRPSG